MTLPVQRAGTLPLPCHAPAGPNLLQSSVRSGWKTIHYRVAAVLAAAGGRRCRDCGRSVSKHMYDPRGRRSGAPITNRGHPCHREGIGGEASRSQLLQVSAQRKPHFMRESGHDEQRETDYTLSDPPLKLCVCFFYWCGSKRL